ncbi:hypothetical protein EV356DRAFT_194390 [Viridothelium virens]|uniref:HNH domain-containing protein n=1 Tax=Viridothelium virens TaxID=1048519 RepID=A0A6A6H7C5_VIRVR|nr:hypothetical protein EV356DRAFT_194390 [Viridothelium virens]
MSSGDGNDEDENYEVFRDCLSTPIIQKLAAPKRPERRRAAKGRKNAIKRTDEPREEKEVDDAEELVEFIDYLATEIFNSLPFFLRTLSYSSSQASPSLLDDYSSLAALATLTTSLPPHIIDSLTTYTLTSSPSTFLPPILNTYITALTTPPPPPTSASRPSACELCSRSHIPLTIHHLIPRSCATKAVKRGWCEPWEPTTRLAFLCRACHSFVHGLAGNEELARSKWGKR